MLDHANYLYYTNVDSFDGGHAKVTLLLVLAIMLQGFFSW